VWMLVAQSPGVECVLPNHLDYVGGELATSLCKGWVELIDCICPVLGKATLLELVPS